MTRTAAREIGSREINLPKENVGTLHSMTFRCGEKHTVFTPQKHAKDFSEDFPAFPMDGKTAEDPGVDGELYGNQMLRELELHRARMTEHEIDPTSDLGEFLDCYTRFKRNNFMIDFTDMIETALHEIDCPFDYLIADEAQDYSRLEFALLKKWGGQCEGIVIAGDADQCLFEFRGSSAGHFILFGDERRVLGQSYRVPRAVHEYSETLTRRMDLHEEREYNPRDEEGAVEYKSLRSAAEVANFAADLEGTVMLLASCGYIANWIANALKERGLPFHNPYRVEGSYAAAWNPLTRGKRRVTATDRAIAFLSPPWTWKSLHDWMGIMKGLPRGAKQEMMDNAKERPGDLPPIDWIAARIGPSGLAAALSGDFRWWLPRLVKGKDAALQYPRRVYELHGLSALTERPKIIVGTIHSVKGGEADNVVLIPDLSVKFWKEFMYVNPDPVLRMFFVGATRARRNLYLTEKIAKQGYRFQW